MRSVVVAACLLALAIPAAAQVDIPQVSQRASVLQRIGTTNIEVAYHRPGVKGRQIWGGLVPYDTPWRMGANEATTISFSDPVTIDGKEVPAGKYSFFAIPSEKEWTFVINKDPDQWGAFGYDPEKDQLRVKVTPSTTDHVEWMRITIDPTSPTSADVTLRWEKLAVSMAVDVDVKKVVWKDVDTAVAATANAAANWALDSGERLEAGLEWVDQAIAMEGATLFNQWTKARLLQKLGRAKDAVPVMENTLSLAKGNVPDEFWRILQGSMASIRKDAGM